MSLVHDMAECIVGDITPHCGIAKDEKLRREREGMECLLDSFGKETVPGKYHLFRSIISIISYFNFLV